MAFLPSLSDSLQSFPEFARILRSHQRLPEQLHAADPGHVFPPAGHQRHLTGSAGVTQAENNGRDSSRAQSSGGMLLDYPGNGTVKIEIKCGEDSKILHEIVG